MTTTQTLLAARCETLFARHRRWAREAGQKLAYKRPALLAWLGGRFGERPLCAYCSAVLAEATFTLDHDVPRSRGGAHALSNLALCCETCNVAKGQLSGEEFRQLLQLVQSWPPVANHYVLTSLRQAGRVKGMRRKGWL